MDNLLKTLLDLIFPPKCLGCNRFGVSICPKCLWDVELDTAKECIVCQKPNVKGFTHVSCSTFYTPERLITPFSYNGLIKKYILSGKYGPKVFYLFEHLVNIAVPILEESGIGFGENSLIIPMPLYEERFLYRGFNQSDVISGMLSKRFRLDVDKKLLMRTGGTKAQSKLSKIDRRENVKDAFKVMSLENSVMNNVRGKDIILVDDICTTGATFLAASKALKLAGARFIWCFALAKA